MVNVNFNCSPSRVGKTGVAPIFVSIYIDGKRNQFPLALKMDPKKFISDTQSKEDNPTKQYLQSVREKIDGIVIEMQKEGIALTPDAIKDFLAAGCVKKVYTVGDCFRDIQGLKEDEAKTGYIKDRSKDRYDTCLAAFYAANKIDEDFPCSSVTVKHFHNLQNYLKKQGKAQNTIYTYLAKARAAFRFAFLNGHIKAAPYAAFHFDKGEDKDIIFLTEEELKIIRNHKYVSQATRDKAMMFLIQCYCGLAIADFQQLKPSDFHLNELGQVYIEGKRKKTGKRFCSVILKEGKEILEEYGYQLPMCCAPVYNRGLKSVAEACGIEKNLHSHLARTTYISLLYNHHIPTSTICKLVGDSAKVILQYYAELDNKTIFEDIAKEYLAVSAPDPIEVTIQNLIKNK